MKPFIHISILILSTMLLAACSPSGPASTPSYGPFSPTIAMPGVDPHLLSEPIGFQYRTVRNLTTRISRSQAETIALHASRQDAFAIAPITVVSVSPVIDHSFVG